MYINLLFGLIGGLGFFFYGMNTMSDGLKKIAGERIKNILSYVTSVPVVGVLTGTLITVLIQSSSAMTVMVVGFVNAGLLTLKQAICVILGANIGTTFTAWLVSFMGVFKITTYALPLVGIGFAIMSFSKTKKMKSWGQVMLGFGILFVGLGIMKDSFDPLSDSQAIKDIFVKFGENPLLGVLTGITFTILLQSSSATIAIIQVLAFNGLLSFESTIPLVLGDNIGTTITAQMAAIGGTINARRAAMSHTMFNVIGVAYMLVFVYMGLYTRFIDAIIPGVVTQTNIMFHIAVAHSAFNVINVIIFLPFISLLERISVWLVPQKDELLDVGIQYLEKHLLDTPSLALEQIHKEIAYALKVARKAAVNAFESLLEGNTNKAQKASDLETATDNLQSEITQYIIDLSQRNLLEEESEQLPVLIHNINDIERIGDHAQNISEIAKRKIEEKYPFTEIAVNELKRMWEEVFTMLQETERALAQKDIELAKQILLRENTVNNLQSEFKNTHIKRLNEGSCQLQSGFLFLECVDNLEKIADRVTNIAESVINKMKWEEQHQRVGEAEETVES